MSLSLLGIHLCSLAFINLTAAETGKKEKELDSLVSAERSESWPEIEHIDIDTLSTWLCLLASG